MGEETSHVMNFDLNLGPEVESETISNQLVNSDDLIAEPIERISEAFRVRDEDHWRLQEFHIPHETHTLPVELNELMGNSDNVSTLLPGEGSVGAEERTRELPKTCEKNCRISEDTVSVKKFDVEKGSGQNGSFFDCSICLELAMDPVVSSCGHLFCWPCLYQWFHVNSDAKNCPVCNEDMNIKNVIPIYGRGSNSRKPEKDSCLQIPLRPQARRVESFRQIIYRNPFSFPLEEIIRRLGSRFHLTRALNLPQDSNDAREREDRTNSFQNIATMLGGMQSDQMPSGSLVDIDDITDNGTSITEAMQTHQLRPLLLQRSQSLAQRSFHTLSSTFRRAERLLEVFIRSHPIARNQEQSLTVFGRDSFSSIAAVINSESQVDTAVESDSMGSLSTSSSRSDALRLRVRDVNGGDSRASRRRRLN